MTSAVGDKPGHSKLPSGFVVIRHGRREDTDNPLWQHRARFPFDTPLVKIDNEIGEAAKRLQRTFDVVYTSPFLRCLETTERLLRALACEDTPVYVHKGLSEVHNPHLLFKTRYPSISQRARHWLWRSTYKRHSRPVRQRFDPKARILDSCWPQMPESEHGASIRFREVMLELAARHPGQQVLIVSHGKSVQVAHESLGCRERLHQVGFAGFIACRAKTEQQRWEEEGQGRDRGAGGVQWTDFTRDPEVPYFNVDVATT